jgi:ubiquinone/menaquinone biosynthesis C-methylase UbiE
MAPFDAPAEHYDRFMGRYLPSLASAFVDAAGIGPGMRVLDVGSGPGGLTRELSDRVGAAGVAAIDPAPQFVAACRARNPGVDARQGVAEHLPWPDGEFDATLSSLVVGFMADPDAGVREMARVTRGGGTVAACVWDIATGGMTMLTTFWDAVHQIDPHATGERAMAGSAPGDIAARFRRAGLRTVFDGEITAHADYTGVDDFWTPFTLGVGPAGQYLRSVPADTRTAIRAACRESVPDGPFRMTARAWCAVATTGSA